MDFVCLEKKLIVELDGGQHAEQHRYDASRDRWLNIQGYAVLRFWNDQVLTKIEDVKDAIYRALTKPPLLCKPGMVYILDRAHGLHIFEVGFMPVISRQDLFRSLIERAE